MAMSGNIAKARQFMEDGEKCLTKWSIFGNSTKHEDAAENFEKAGRLFKVAKEGDEAARAYEKAAEHFLISKSSHEAGRSFVEAARCRKGSPEAVTAFLKAIDIFGETGRFQQAGKMYAEIGDIYQADGKFEEAVEALRQGADLLLNEGASAQANACLVKVAGMLSKDMKPPKLGEAAKIYEQLGQSCVEKKLLQMNAKSYWLQAGLCLLALGDTVGARNKMVDFCDADHNFEGSREYRFFENLTKTLEDLDVEAFSQHCFEYDEISKLDPWKTSMLLKIKRTIQAQEGEGEDIDLR